MLRKACKTENSFNLEPGWESGQFEVNGVKVWRRSPIWCFVLPLRFSVVTRFSDIPIGVSRSFILSFTGSPEPSGKECQEGSHSVWIFENSNRGLAIHSIV